MTSATRTHAPIRNMYPELVERLRLAFPAETFTICRVPQQLSADAFADLVRDAPVIGIGWRGIRPDANSGRVLKGSGLWRLLLIYKSSGANELRFSGDQFGWGIDDMADVAAVIMHGWTLDGIGACSVTDVQAVVADGYAKDDIELAQIDFEVSFTVPSALLSVKDPADLSALGLAWTANNSTTTVTETIDPRA